MATRDKVTQLANARQAVVNLTQAVADLKTQEASPSVLQLYEALLAKEQAKVDKLEAWCRRRS